MKKSLNIGLVGYGFMGRTHSNAFRQAPIFFDLPWKPVLKAVAARNVERVRSFAENWGYESFHTDWRDLVARPDIDLIDIASPNDTHHPIALAAAKVCGVWTFRWRAAASPAICSRTTSTRRCG